MMRSSYFLFAMTLAVGLTNCTTSPEQPSPQRTPTRAAEVRQAVPEGSEFKRLGYWRFNDATWQSENGQAPLVANNLESVPGFDGNAVRIAQTNALLKYRGIEDNGRPTLDCGTGSIRFWFKPLWDSVRPPNPVPSGTGPGRMVRLLALGVPTDNAASGWFGMTIEPAGTKLWFSTIDNRNRTNWFALSGHTSFSSNEWTEIVATYTTNEVYVWQDGFSIMYSRLAHWPSPSASLQALGFSLGSNTNGAEQARGLYDELETFNYPLGPTEAKRNGRVLSASASAAPLQIQLQWRANPNLKHSLRRKRATENAWNTLTNNYTGWSFTDRNVTLGQTYDYQLLNAAGGQQSITTAFFASPVEQRGKIVLLVDKTKAGELAAELEQLKTDLIGDGWTVLRHDVPRHVDDYATTNSFRVNANNITKVIKPAIVADYNADPAHTKAVFIVGHVAIPYSGFFPEDGHGGGPVGNHAGAWAADIYYGDIDGRWTDTAVSGNPNPLSFLESVNVPGDGKFDQDTVPPNPAGERKVELAVGRIDFARLPAFYSGSVGKSETELLRQYLNKAHRYRHKQLALNERVMSGGLFGPSSGQENDDIYKNALVNGSRWFGLEPGKIIDGDLFTQTQSWLWGMQGGLGQPDRINDSIGSTHRHTTADLAKPNQEPPIGFYLLKGSWFADWNLSTDNLMRAALATPNYGLAALWVRNFDWRLEGMALGETLGDGWLRTANDTNQTFLVNGARRSLALLGDPTLRLHILAPPVNLRVEQNGNHVTLGWRPTPAPEAKYFVYRAANADGPFTRLTKEPLADTAFTTAGSAEKWYQVRALAPVQSGSGAYTNLSQGIFGRAN